MKIKMLYDKSAVVIEMENQEKKLLSYFINYLDKLEGVAVTVGAQADGTFRFVFSRRSYGVVLDLFDGLRSPYQEDARKLVGMYNLIMRVVEEDVEKTDVKPILKLIQGGKKDE